MQFTDGEQVVLDEMVRARYADLPKPPWMQSHRYTRLKKAARRRIAELPSHRSWDRPAAVQRLAACHVRAGRQVRDPRERVSTGIESAPGLGTEKCTTRGLEDASEWRGGEAVGRAGAALGRVCAAARGGRGAFALWAGRVEPFSGPAAGGRG
jgi:hypothetical protein